MKKNLLFAILSTVSLLQGMEYSFNQGCTEEDKTEQQWYIPPYPTAQLAYSLQDSEIINYARIGNIQKVKELLDAGVFVDCQNTTGTTALHIAAQKGFVDMVMLLLQRQAMPNIPDHTGATPLHLAASWGHKRVVQELLRYNAFIDQIDFQGNTALFYAVFQQKVALAEFLKDQGANLLHQNKEGNTPLSCACMIGNKRLIDLFADDWTITTTNNEKNTLVHILIGHGHYVLFKELVEKFPSLKKYVNNQNWQGMTPLHCAAIRGDWQSARKLVELGANVNICEHQRGRTPAHICLRNHEEAAIKADSKYEYDQKISRRLKDENVFNFLLALDPKKIDKNIKDVYGFTVRSSLNYIGLSHAGYREEIADILSDKPSTNYLLPVDEDEDELFQQSQTQEDIDWSFDPDNISSIPEWNY